MAEARKYVFYPLLLSFKGTIIYEKGKRIFLGDAKREKKAVLG
ncbi:MAG: hypothetical protein ACHBN1_02510 [Heteroscytonema crispum UTEX LB 1556]